MLYQFHEWQSVALTPARLLVEAAHEFARHPLTPAAYTPFSGMLAGACEMLELSSRKHRKPGFNVAGVTIDGKATAVRERAVECRPFCTLLNFACARAAAAPKVLVVAPLSGHFAAQLREVIAALLSDHDVYVTDWADAREVPVDDGPFDLDDYIGYVRDFLRLLGGDTHVIAICQATVPALATAALMAAAGERNVPRSLILFGGPIDTRRNPTSIDSMATTHSLAWFERTQIATVPSHYPGRGRRVHPGFIQRATFMASNVDRLTRLHFKLLQAGMSKSDGAAAVTRRFFDEYLSVMDLPAEFYLQTVRRIFQTHELPRGRMTWRDQAVDPSALRDTGLMTVEAGRDDISGRGQTEAAHDLCPNVPEARRARVFDPEADHIDLFTGPHWRKRILPHVRDFIHARA